MRACTDSLQPQGLLAFSPLREKPVVELGIGIRLGPAVVLQVRVFRVLDG